MREAKPCPRCQNGDRLIGDEHWVVVEALALERARAIEECAQVACQFYYDTGDAVAFMIRALAGEP